MNMHMCVTSNVISVGSSERILCLMRLACLAISSIFGLLTDEEGTWSLASDMTSSTMPRAYLKMLFTAISLAC